MATTQHHNATPQHPEIMTMTNMTPDQQQVIQMLQIASTGRKPSKELAAQIVRELAAMPAMADHLLNLADLYRYFAPAARQKGKAAKDPAAWCALGLNPKDVRPPLMFIMADGRYIHATDGHRAHRVADSRAPGLYDPVSGVRMYNAKWSADAPAGHPGNYPDIHRITDDKKTPHQWSGTPTVRMVGPHAGVEAVRFAGTDEKGQTAESPMFNGGYVADAVQAMGDDWRLSAPTADEVTPAWRLESADGTRTAWIMPLRS